MSILLWLTTAFASVTGGSLDLYGAGALQPMAPSLDGPARDIAMGCGGVGFTIADQKRRNSKGLRPESISYHIALVDACYGVGSNNDAFYLAPFNFGMGAQWGGSVLYLTTEANVGIGVYEEDHGPGTYGVAGLAAKARIAPGIQTGVVAIEIGPTLRTIAPIYTQIDNAYPDGWFKGIGSFDVMVRLGGSSPNHANHPILRR